MKRTTPLLVLVCALFSLACIAAPDGPDKDKDKPETVTFNAKVTHVDLEGGFWGLVADDGTKYAPTHLDADYRHEGMRVHVEGTIQKDAVSSHMWGKIIQITTITNPNLK